MPTKRPRPERRIVDWKGIKSLAIANDGRLYAGENGGFRVAAWAPDGTKLWEQAVARATNSMFRETWIDLIGDDLVVMARSANSVTKLFVLDPVRGKIRRTVKIPTAAGFRADRDRLVLAYDDTAILSYPTLVERARFEDYTTKLQLATPPDGRWIAAVGPDGTHVYDGRKLRLVRTIPSEADAYSVAFASDGRLVVGDAAGRLGIFDPATGKQLARVEVASERKRRPTVIAMAADGRYVAAGRDDGVLVVVGLETYKVTHRFDRHVGAGPSLATNALDGIGFHGDILWVTGTPKDEPIGLTGYVL